MSESDELTILRGIRQSWIDFGKDDLRYQDYCNRLPPDAIGLAYCEWLRHDRDRLLAILRETK